jgi:predicted enzyme related to lactoylglutathione lyase
MPVSSVAFTMYPVTDVPRAVAFYRDVLGLEQLGPDLPFWVEFDIAGATFGVGNFEQVGKAGTAQSLSLEITDLPAFRETLLAKGVESSEPFETQVCWISGVSDPDGNRIWLHQAKKA